MFQKVKFYNGKNLKGWLQFLEELSKDNATGILLFIAEETPFNYKKIQPLLKKMKTIVVGGVFPAVIYDGSLYKQGVVGCAFKSPISIEVIKNLSKFNGSFPEKILLKNIESILILNDGWADNIPLLIESLYEITHKEMTFIGGGTGSLTNINRPSLFTSDDFFASGAIITAIEGSISIGINHGWQPIHGPVIASRVKGRILKSINWEPAFKYYKNIVEEDTGIKLTAENFLELAESHPLGMLKYDNEIILRVPLGVDEKDNLFLGSEMPENSMLMITKGYPEKLIEAAGMAAEQVKAAYKNRWKKSPTKVLIIDCITRSLFLGDRFSDELKTIEEKTGDGVLLFGFLSLGEVASTGDKYIELHNKTVVVGMM